MKKYLAYVLLVVCLLALSGCNKKDSQTLDRAEIKENTTLINADGTVQAVIVESFDKNYYKKEELKNYIQQEVQKYTQKAGNDTVVLNSLEVENRMAIAQLSYKKLSDYASFNAVTSELLTKEEALKDERISNTIYSVDKGETVDLQSALEGKDYKVLLVELSGETVITEGKIEYYTNGTLTGDSAVKTGSEGVTVIIYE